MELNDFTEQIFHRTGTVDRLIQRGGNIVFLGRNAEELMWRGCTIDDTEITHLVSYQDFHPPTMYWCIDTL